MNTRTPTRLFLAAITATTLTGLVLAQSTGRVINIKGGQAEGNPRNGPLEFSGDFTATVQKLQIKGKKATLSTPPGKTLSEAEGTRIAAFDGGVVVTRGRLTAKGPSLEYKESTGLGVLAGPTNVVQKPEKAGDDDVIITSATSTFDVDSDVSTSEGSVKFVNGKQSGSSDKIVFDEKANLACLTGSKSVSLVREPKKEGQNKLTITSKESRVLTETNLLYAIGTVMLVSGNNTTSGDTLYYDDEKEIAYISGRPAKNVNKKDGAVISGSTIINNTKIGQVKQGNPFNIPLEKFKCPSVK
jgi:lipopolysaccharide export system protein LptA